MATVTKIQRNIIIGADAQKFYDAMRGINNQIAHVDATLKQMEKSQMRNVASGHLLSQAITDIGRAFVQYIQGAVESAQKLPPGLYSSVDALREAKKEAEALDTVVGIMLSQSFADATNAATKFKSALAAFNQTGTNIFDFITNYDQYAEIGNIVADSITEAVEQETKLTDQAKRFEKVQERLAKVAAERAKNAQKAAEAARIERLELEGIKNIQRNEINEMVFGNQKKANTGFNYEGEALLREAFDASEMTDFTSEMERLGQIAFKTNEELAKQAMLVDFVGNAFNDMFYTALISGKDFFTQMGQWVENYIKRLAAAAAAAAALTLITGGASGAGGGFMSIFSRLIGLPKLAHGGIVNKATPVLAGEAGPEAIIPLNQLNRMGGNLTARISGRDLLLLLEREQTVKARGYGN